MTERTTEHISVFWNWFEHHSTDFGDHFQNAELIKELDARVSELDESITWELGPGYVEANNFMLVLSPDGDKERLVLTKRLIEFAPACKGWEFYAAKPPKQWDRLFFIEDKPGKEIEIDASNWRYVLLEFPDGTFDAIVAAPELSIMSGDIQQTAAAIVFDAELGEERRLTLINSIEVVAAFNHEYSSKSSPIKVVAEHLRSITS